jgi:hypothetical protein
MEQVTLHQLVLHKEILEEIHADQSNLAGGGGGGRSCWSKCYQVLQVLLDDGGAGSITSITRITRNLCSGGGGGRTWTAPGSLLEQEE